MIVKAVHRSGLAAKREKENLLLRQLPKRKEDCCDNGNFSISSSRRSVWGVWRGLREKGEILSKSTAEPMMVAVDEAPRISLKASIKSPPSLLSSSTFWRAAFRQAIERATLRVQQPLLVAILIWFFWFSFSLSVYPSSPACPLYTPHLAKLHIGGAAFC